MQQRGVESLSRTAEKLIILLDYSNGLLTRIHGCVHYKAGPVFDGLNKAVIEHLKQKKADPSVNVNKASGANEITMRAEALENETRFVYETLQDILVFKKEVEPLLDTLLRNIMIFDVL